MLENKKVIILIIGIVLWASIFTELYFYQLAKYNILKDWCAIEVMK